MDSTDLPDFLRDLLAGSPFEAATLKLLETTAPVLTDNKTPFFPAYTDHGKDHVLRVVSTAARLVPADVKGAGVLRAEDASVLLSASLMHDLAMHLREDGFVQLVDQSSANPPLSWFDRQQSTRGADQPWPQLWTEFRREARHFNTSQLDRLLGDNVAGVPSVAFADELDPASWVTADRLLIGEFIRRHHARLAHEIALYGFPGAGSAFPVLSASLPQLADAVGTVARSHNESLRAMLDYCEYQQPGNKRPWNVCVAYLMGLLRVADYLQLDADRAPTVLLRLKNPASRTSLDEWMKHQAVSSISWDVTDPAAIHIEVGSGHSLSTHLQLQELVAGLQMEMDTTMAVLSEIYPGGELAQLRLDRQRVRTNLNEPSLRERLPYVPRRAALRSDEDLFRLVVSDLYGDQPSVAGRELVQNAVDAVRERRRWETNHGRVNDLRSQGVDVLVKLSERSDGTFVLQVSDCGIGMTEDVVVDYFLKAGASFGPTAADFEGLRAEDAIAGMKAGRFGIGAFAAFLLGPAIRVRTRFAASEDGLRFEARVGDEFVELAREDVLVGTEVAVEIDSSRVPLLLAERSRYQRETGPQRFLASIASWYRLSDPNVRFELETQDGTRTAVKSGATIPTPRRRLPDDWRSVRVDGFDAVLWEQMREQWEPQGRVIHNGIVIRDPTTSLIREDTGYRWSGSALNALLARPMIAVFDSRHALGITLQRYALKSPVLPFEEQLLASIGLDLAAWALVRGTRRHPLATGWGLAPVRTTSGDVPLLPGLVARYTHGDVWVLWTDESTQETLRFYDERDNWSAATDAFHRRRGAVSWTTAPVRTVLDATIDAAPEPGESEPEEWGIRLADVVTATRKLAESLDARVRAAVVVREEKLYGRWREPTWVASEIKDNATKYVLRDPQLISVHDEKVEDSVGTVASTLLEQSPRGMIAISVLELDRESRQDDATLVEPWQRHVGGPLPRSAEARRRMRERATAASLALRTVVNKISRVEREAASRHTR